MKLSGDDKNLMSVIPMAGRWPDSTAPKPSRAPKNCYWYNGKLYCIYYGITSGNQ